MARISDETRARNEQAIRPAMDRMLRGELPPGGKCDLKTLAAEAGVTRTGFYPKKNRDGTERPGPYQHLAEEFERRLQALQDAGQVPDLRAAQIERLKAEVRRAQGPHRRPRCGPARAGGLPNPGRLPAGRPARGDHPPAHPGRPGGRGGQPAASSERR
ncbi:hypothetical protein [Streptomyces luteolifulvus]|uniref:hypothetical protein n=1 Tax=Streptomyces luteolifulvus TaxID=2615112 RepID=UPI002EDA1672